MIDTALIDDAKDGLYLSFKDYEYPSNVVQSVLLIKMSVYSNELSNPKWKMEEILPCNDWWLHTDWKIHDAIYANIRVNKENINWDTPLEGIAYVKIYAYSYIIHKLEIDHEYLLIDKITEEIECETCEDDNLLRGIHYSILI